MVTPEQIDTQRHTIARAYRHEMECLLIRVEGIVKALDQLDDEELARRAGFIPGPKERRTPQEHPEWLHGPLYLAHSLLQQLATLNYVKFVQLENQAAERAANA